MGEYLDCLSFFGLELEEPNILVDWIDSSQDYFVKHLHMSAQLKHQQRGWRTFSLGSSAVRSRWLSDDVLIVAIVRMDGIIRREAQFNIGL
jgi:hypothetical protein